jgi:hypothetical protein
MGKENQPRYFLLGKKRKKKKKNRREGKKGMGTL